MNETSRHWERPPRSVIALGGVLLVLCAAFVIYTGWPLRYADELQYLEISNNLAHGRGFSIASGPTAYRPPAWPFLIAPLVGLAEPGRWLLVLPAVLLGASAVLAGRIAARLSGSPWGWTAGLLVLLYPLDLYTASTLYPQMLATVMLLGLWALILESTEDPRTGPRLGGWQAALVGLTVAGLALAVPTMIFSGGVICLWIWLNQRARRLRTAVLMGIGFLVPILAWTIRNLVVLGAPVPFSTSSGQNLLIGNNPSATPDSGLAVDIRMWVRGASGRPEPERDAYYRQAAIDWISQHPWDAFVLWVGKLLNYFNPYNAPSTEGRGSTVAMLISWISFALLVGAVVVRIVLRKSVPLWRSELLYLWLFVLNAPVMAVFFTRTRFRQPMDATLVAIAAVPIAIGISMLLDRRRSGVTHRSVSPVSEPGQP